MTDYLNRIAGYADTAGSPGRLSRWDDLQNYAGAILGTAGSLWGLISDPPPPDDNSVILLDGNVIPGIVQSEECSKRRRRERIQQEGLSGSVKLYQGFDDPDLRFTLILTSDEPDPDLLDAASDLLALDPRAAMEDLTGGNSASLTAADKLAAITKLEHTVDTDGNPKVWQITQEIANVRGISHVTIAGVSAIRTSRSDTIEVGLEFDEHIDAHGLIETGQSMPDDSDAAPSETTNPLETE